jgi:hypothetical protein
MKVQNLRQIPLFSALFLTTSIYLQTVFKGKKCGVSDTKERISEKQESYGSYFSEKNHFCI